MKYDKNGNIAWQKSYGGEYTQSFDSVASTEDGGYIVVGETDSKKIEGLQNKGGDDAIIVKYDEDGNMIWHKNYGGSSQDFFYSIASTEDGGNIVVGKTASTDIEGLPNNGNYDAIIVKYDKNGNMIWHKNYGGNDDDHFYSVALTDDGGYIVVGQTGSTDIEGLPNNGNYDAIIVKYDKNGNMVWQKNYGGSMGDGFKSVVLAKDGDYIVVGSSQSYNIEGLQNKGNDDGIIVKYDKNGNVVWQNSNGGSHVDNYYSISATEDEGFIVAGGIKSTDIEGITNNGGVDALIVKYDKNGNMVWQKNYGGNLHERFEFVITTEVGEYILISNSTSTNIEGITNNGRQDALIVKYSIEYNLEKTTTENGTASVKQNGNLGIITPIPNEGYSVDKVIVKDTAGNEISVTANSDGTYTFNLYDDVIIDVSFAREFLIEKEDVNNGIVDIIKMEGNIGAITPVPNEGYVVDKVTVKDSLGNEIKTTKLDDGTYLFELNDDVTVEVSFVRNFKISKVYTKNGDVEVSKIDGGRGLVSFKPNSGFEFDKVVVKNSKDELVEVTKLEDGTYSFELSDDVSVEVVFKRELVNPKTGVVNSGLALLVGFIISFIGYTLTKKNCENYGI